MMQLANISMQTSYGEGNSWKQKCYHFVVANLNELDGRKMQMAKFGNPNAATTHIRT